MRTKGRFTVLLLRPDHVADGFGQDTYLAQVSAPTPQAAIKVARREVTTVDGIDDLKAEDYYPLITVRGWHGDLTPESSRNQQPREA